MTCSTENSTVGTRSCQRSPRRRLAGSHGGDFRRHRAPSFQDRTPHVSPATPGSIGEMISSSFERGRFAQVLRAAGTFLGGDGERNTSPREPYMQGVTANSAVICWVSAGPDAGVVEYGKTPNWDARKPRHGSAGATQSRSRVSTPARRTITAWKALAGRRRRGASAPLPRATTHASASRWSATAAAGGRDSWQWQRCWNA